MASCVLDALGVCESPEELAGPRDEAGDGLEWLEKMGRRNRKERRNEGLSWAF